LNYRKSLENSGKTLDVYPLSVYNDNHRGGEKVGKHERPKKPARQIDWLTILIGMLADLITGTILLILAKIVK